MLATLMSLIWSAGTPSRQRSFVRRPLLRDAVRKQEIAVATMATVVMLVMVALAIHG